mmetsp:Transcript_48477/g.115266  ORF Transcript_48477/g.115266 Transcript_48477/m.115266 type:complete len:152 (+) Transcript_48477:423-878(+)
MRLWSPIQAMCLGQHPEPETLQLLAIVCKVCKRVAFGVASNAGIRGRPSSTAAAVRRASFALRAAFACVNEGKLLSVKGAGGFVCHEDGVCVPVVLVITFLLRFAVEASLPRVELIVSDQLLRDKVSRDRLDCDLLSVGHLALSEVRESKG